MSTATDLEQFIDAQGFRHFKGREFTPYWTRTRKGVRNSVPPKKLWKNILATLRLVDALRAELGAPITLLSTYRSPDYNHAVGGASASYHMQFLAIDFTCSKGTPAEWAKRLTAMRAAGKFKGGIGIYRRSHFVHIDTRGSNADWRG